MNLRTAARADPYFGRTASPAPGPQGAVTDCASGRAFRGPTARPLPGGGTLRRHRTRLVGETTMSQRNGSTPAPPNGVATDMGELTHDLLSLAELQFELFRTDCRAGMKGLLLPVGLLLLAVIVATGTAPVALLFLAEFVAQAAGLSRAAAFAVAALAGFVAAAALGAAGWARIRGVERVFQRSREELNRNMTWIKRRRDIKPPRPSATSDALKRSAASEEEPYRDR